MECHLQSLILLFSSPRPGRSDLLNGITQERSLIFQGQGPWQTFPTTTTALLGAHRPPWGLLEVWARSTGYCKHPLSLTLLTVSLMKYCSMVM